MCGISFLLPVNQERMTSPLSDPSSTFRTLRPSTRLPALFIGHGSPMNAVEENDWRRGWQALGREFAGGVWPTPQLILSVSAHWLTHGWWLTGMDRPRTIHDFGAGALPVMGRDGATGAPELRALPAAAACRRRRPRGRAGAIRQRGLPGRIDRDAIDRLGLNAPPVTGPWRSTGKRSRCSCCSARPRTCARCRCRTRRTRCAGGPSGPC